MNIESSRTCAFLVSAFKVGGGWGGGAEASLGDFTPLQQRYANVDDCVFPV